MNRLILLLIILSTAANVSAQCMCGDIKLRLVLPGLDTSSTSYTISTLPSKTVALEKERHFKKTETEQDTVHFRYGTKGGIDTLHFIVKNLTTKKKMDITVVNMHYDNPYSIDLTTFTEGQFLFDWKIMDKCQQENLHTELITCGRLKFYQIELVNQKDMYWPKGFVDNKIRPFDIGLFAYPN